MRPRAIRQSPRSDGGGATIIAFPHTRARARRHLAPGSWRADQVRPRKDLNRLSERELADYIHALDILCERSLQDPDDPTGYAYQAALHDDAVIGPGEHGSDLFLPWHRAHLHYFERLLQEADPPRTSGVTIPYWDWMHGEADGKFPEGFDRWGLYAAGRSLAEAELPPDTLEIVTTEHDPRAFGGYPAGDPDGDYGRLELGPHNYMHGFFVGGLMRDPSTAGQDPIYWSFHAFLDLLWSEWQRRNGSPPPTSPTAVLRGFLDQRRHTVADVQDTRALGYEYAYTAALTRAFGIRTAVPAARRLLAVRSLEPLFLGRAETELRRTSRVQFSVPAVSPAAVSAVIRLNRLAVPTTGSYLLRAYVHPGGAPFDPDDPKRLEVGYVALWKSPDRAACTVRFDVGPVLAGVIPAAHANFVLTLQYVPAPGSERSAEVQREFGLGDVVLETYGPGVLPLP